MDVPRRFNTKNRLCWIICYHTTCIYCSYGFNKKKYIITFLLIIFTSIVYVLKDPTLGYIIYSILVVIVLWLGLKTDVVFNHDDLKDLNKITYEVGYDEDLAITGLGFVKIVNKGVIDLYIDKNVDVFLRKSLI